MRTAAGSESLPSKPGSESIVAEDRTAAWTLEQATELALEQFADLLDGCDDEDTVRTALVFEAMRQVWSPSMSPEWDESITAGQMRQRIAAGRRRLAEKVAA
jgi:hypothetical protein